MFIVFSRSLGNNNFPCDCSIAWLWKDYKGRIQILPSNLIGFHKGTKHFTPLRCYKEKQGQKMWHSFNKIDLKHCHIEGTIDQGVKKSKESQLTFACSNSTKETLEKGGKYVQS